MSGKDFLPANASVATLVALAAALAGKGVAAELQVVCKATFASPGSYRPTKGTRSATITAGDTRMLCELLAELRDEGGDTAGGGGGSSDGGRSEHATSDPFAGSTQVPAGWACGIDVAVTLLADNDNNNDDDSDDGDNEAVEKVEAEAGKILKRTYWSHVNPGYYYRTQCSPVGREVYETNIYICIDLSNYLSIYVEISSGNDGWLKHTRILSSF